MALDNIAALNWPFRSQFKFPPTTLDRHSHDYHTTLAFSVSRACCRLNGSLLLIWFVAVFFGFVSVACVCSVSFLRSSLYAAWFVILALVFLAFLRILLAFSGLVRVYRARSHLLFIVVTFLRLIFDAQGRSFIAEILFSFFGLVRAAFKSLLSYTYLSVYSAWAVFLDLVFVHLHFCLFLWLGACFSQIY